MNASPFRNRQPQPPDHGPLHDAFTRLREALSARIVGQSALVERLLIALLADGHLLVEGAPGLAKTTAIRALAGHLEADFAPCPVHPRPAAGRPHRYRDLAFAGRAFRIRPRPDLPPDPVGRRNQPRSGQGAVGAAGSHGRAPGHRRPPHLRAAVAVPGDGHAEPDRAGRHLPVARSAAGPLPHARAHRLPARPRPKPRSCAWRANRRAMP